MLISHFSKDGKRGFAVGSNRLTPEKMSAGLITAASAVLIAAVGGLFKKPNPRAGAKQKKRRPIWLAAVPFIYKKAKTTLQKKSYNKLVDDIIKAEDAEQKSDIEVVNAIPISSEQEVYDHI